MTARIVFVLLLSVISFLAFAHDEELPSLDLSAYNRGEHVYPVMLWAGAVVLALAAASVVFENRFGEGGKKLAFYSITGVSLAATLFLVFAVAQVMLDSETRGPVHWHADFEVWACDRKLELKQADGFSTRVGPLLLHHHGDNRIHVEGIIRKRGDVSLGNFFAAIAPELGGRFTEDAIAVALADGTLARFHNGDLCADGRPGSLKLFVNGKPEPLLDKYVLSPHTDVPPGDVLKIVFDSS